MELIVLNLFKDYVQKFISSTTVFFKYMTNFKLTISDQKGKSLTKELKDKEVNPLLGIQLGADFDAAVVGLAGKIKLTGGSDKSGVPMRSDIHGSARKYVLLSKGVGLQDAEKGQRKRKLVRGNTISEEIYQINCRYDGELKIEKTVEKSETDSETKKETKAVTKEEKKETKAVTKEEKKE